MSNFKEFSILDIANIHNDKRIPLSSTQRNERRGNFDYYGASGVIDGVDDYLFDGEYVLISEDGENLRSRKTPIAFKAKGKFWVNNHAHILQGKTGFYNDILVYYFANLDLNEFITGAVQPKLNKSSLLSVPIYLPEDIEEQKAIAGVLSSLDDKIDLLNRQNKTLEQMTETLFAHHFTNNPDKQNWEEGKLSDGIVLFDNKRIPLSKIQRDKMKEGQLYPYYGAATIMDEVNDYIFNGEYILLGEDGTVRTNDGYPVLQYATGKFWVNNHTHVIQAKEPYNNFFIWCYLSKKNIDRIITGAVQPKINQTNLNSLDFPNFPEELVLKFNEIVKPLFDKVLLNKKQIQTLESLRDTLLPKLMSGEVRVEYSKSEVNNVYSINDIKENEIEQVYSLAMANYSKKRHVDVLDICNHLKINTIVDKSIEKGNGYIKCEGEGKNEEFNMYLNSRGDDFVIAHELYHYLYEKEKLREAKIAARGDKEIMDSRESELKADKYAISLLCPEESLLEFINELNITNKELTRSNINKILNHFNITKRTNDIKSKFDMTLTGLGFKII